MLTKEDYIIHKTEMIKELVRFERMTQGDKNPQVTHSIFPYLIMETINLLLNSRPIDDLTDHMASGKKAEQTYDRINKSKSNL